MTIIKRFIAGVLSLALIFLSGCSGYKAEKAEKARILAEQAQRERTVTTLAKGSVAIDSEYPKLNMGETALQSEEKLARRAAVLYMISVYTHSMLDPTGMLTLEEARDAVQSLFEYFDLENDFTVAEMEFLKSNQITEAQLVEYSYSYEGLSVLLWVLGADDFTMDFLKEADAGDLITAMDSFRGIDEMTFRGNIRTQEEVLDAADVVFCLDLALKDGRELPGGLDKQVISQRMRALDWVLHEGSNWDNIGEYVVT